MSKPILCVDFDGVIHAYTSGWKGADVVADGPVPGALHWLKRAAEFFDVQIYSSRTKEPGGKAAMMAAMARWGDDEEITLDFVSFPAQKPAAFLTLDDRAICFNGDFDALDPAAMAAFRPWNKRAQEPAP